MPGTEYTRWCVPPGDLVDVTPEKARDLIIECFYRAQHEMFERTKQRMGTRWDEEAVRKSVSGAVRSAFSQAGGDFDAPSRLDFEQVLQVLGAKARSWGTPLDIIQHHQREIERVLSRLRD